MPARRQTNPSKWFAAALLLALTIELPAHGTGLPGPVQKALDRHRIPADSLSVFVQDVTHDAPMIEHHADRPRNPASVMKLVTTLAALELLGPGHRWTTTVHAERAPRAGVVAGDLHVRGGGDPFLVTEELWKLVQRLRDAGVHTVEGDLVLDRERFDPPPGDPGAFDKKPYRSYNALPDALIVNFNATRFSFWPDRDAGVVRITLDPPSGAMPVDNRLVLEQGACHGKHYRVRMYVDEQAVPPAVSFAGAYPARCGPRSLLRSVHSSDWHFYGAFRALWEQSGGRLLGSMRNGPVPQGARRLLRWRSPMLSEVVRSINKFSNNVMARNLLLSLDPGAGKAPATVPGGRDAIRGWVEGKGLDASSLFVDNGSGLSRVSSASARLVGELLLDAWKSPLMPEFVSSLPLSAVDGTLERRFEGKPVAGRAHMKTGLIDDVRALAGYLHTPSGRTLVVVMLHNRRGIHQGTGTRIQDAMLDALIAR